MNGWALVVWSNEPVAIIMIPLVAALLALLLGRRALPWLPLLVIAGVVLALTGLTKTVWMTGPQRYTIGGWGAPLGIDLYSDGLSLLMLWMTTLVGGLVSLYGFGYFRFKDHQNTLFWPLWLLLWTALNALFLAADIFNLYVTLELLNLAAVALVVLAGGAAALTAGMRYLLFALLGSFAYLLGVALLYGGFGTLDMAQLGQALTAGTLSGTAIALIIVGLLIKTAIFPFHVWLPPAHTNAPAPVSALLSALVVKAAFYLLLRLWLVVFPAVLVPILGQVLGVLGTLAILYGSLQALRQSRLKMLVAYSTVAQLGYLLLVFPMGSLLALRGVVLLAVSHALAKAALFLAAGNVLRVLGHDRLRELNALEQRLPLTLFAFGLAGISIMGLPPSGGFLAKWLLFKAALTSGQWWWGVIVLVGGLLAAGYIFRALRYAFAQTAAAPPEPSAGLPLTLTMQFSPFLLALLALALGLTGAPMLALLDSPSPEFLSAEIPQINWSNALPPLVLLTSLSTGIFIFLLGVA